MKHLSALMACACMISGCQTVPDLPPEDALTITEMIVNVRCEFQAAGNDAKFLKEVEYGYTVGAELSLGVLNGTDIILDSSYAMPGSSIFAPTLKGGMNSSVESMRSVTIQMNYGVEDIRDCGKDREKSDRRLQGKLGFAEWAAKLQETYDTQEIVPFKANYNLEFVLTRSLAVTPGLANRTDAAHVWKISPALGGSSKHTHKLAIVVTKNDKPDKPPKIVTKTLKDGTRKRVLLNAPSSNNAQKNNLELLFQNLPNQ